MNYLKAVIAILFSICKEFEGGSGEEGNPSMPNVASSINKTIETNWICS